MKLHNNIIEIIYSYCSLYNNIIENINNNVIYHYHYTIKYKRINEINNFINEYYRIIRYPNRTII